MNDNDIRCWTSWRKADAVLS